MEAKKAWQAAYRAARKGFSGDCEDAAYYGLGCPRGDLVRKVVRCAFGATTYTRQVTWNRLQEVFRSFKLIPGAEDYVSCLQGPRGVLP